MEATSKTNLRETLALCRRRLREGARLMIGVPDYDAYVAHRRAAHPGEPVMTYAEFFRERQAARYGEGAAGSARGFRCC
ncbi:MAG: CstA-like transporter-associated (seleno)protein [Amaricoccus sp.]